MPLPAEKWYPHSLPYSMPIGKSGIHWPAFRLPPGKSVSRRFDTICRPENEHPENHGAIFHPAGVFPENLRTVFHPANEPANHAGTVFHSERASGSGCMVSLLPANGVSKFWRTVFQRANGPGKFPDTVFPL